MAKASKKRGKKKAAKGKAKAKKSARKSTKRAPAKRKGVKKPARRKGGKKPAKRRGGKKPAKRKAPKRAPKPKPQVEPWPMIFVVLLAIAAALIAGWYANGVAEAAVVLGAVVPPAGEETAASFHALGQCKPAGAWLASAVQSGLPGLH